VVEAPAPQPHDELRRFLTMLEDELGAALQRHPEWFGDYHERFRVAWSEVKPLLSDARDALDPTKLTETQLRDQGLTGAQLQLKMALLDGAAQRLHDAETRSGPATGLRARFRARFPRAASFLGRLAGRISDVAGPAHWFGAFLDVANTILKSLVGVLPIAEPIREFKDAVKAVVSAF
jgi:hypothetical protein